jgi:hypothetical protein
LFSRDVVSSGRRLEGFQTIVRACAFAVVENPFAGRYAEDLAELFDIGRLVGEQLMPDLVAQLSRAPVSYGKGAIVGVNGEFEHGAACIHSLLGRPMRAAVGGGKSLIPSNVKIGPCGVTLDVPLGHKDDPWSFDHFDTLSVMLPDAPLPNEIVIVLAVADGGRPNPRCGQGPR